MYIEMYIQTLGIKEHTNLVNSDGQAHGWPEMIKRFCFLNNNNKKNSLLEFLLAPFMNSRMPEEGGVLRNGLYHLQ